jgi:hypothetical protein
VGNFQSRCNARDLVIKPLQYVLRHTNGLNATWHSRSVPVSISSVVSVQLSLGISIPQRHHNVAAISSKDLRFQWMAEHIA